MNARGNKDSRFLYVDLYLHSSSRIMQGEVNILPNGKVGDYDQIEEGVSRRVEKQWRLVGVAWADGSKLFALFF